MLPEAQAQTTEIIGAATETAAWYSGVAGPMAASWAVVAIGMGFLVWWLVKLIMTQKDELAALKVKSAKDLKQAKIEAEKAADEKVAMAWKRVDEIYSSLQILFGKYDISSDKVTDALQKLTLIFASKGIVSGD